MDDASELVADFEDEQSHIIRRPRLEKLLDETDARVILLVAPAGYGKTTLLRQWLREQQGVVAFVRGRPAIAGTTGLATSIAEALNDHFPGIRERFGTQLRALGADVDPEQLARVLLEAPSVTSSELILAIDDYHAVADGPTDRFTDELVTSLRGRVLLTSRVRPSWANARRIIYGEIFELDAQALALTPQEAGPVLRRHSYDQVPKILALAKGWPAILGLAARVDDFPQGDPDLLFDFLAEELLRGVPELARIDAALVAVAPTITVDLIDEVVTGDTARFLADAVAAGMLMAQGDRAYEMHPLMREFMQRRFGQALTSDHASRLTEFFRANAMWSDLYEVGTRLKMGTVVAQALEGRLLQMLTDGELSTVERWLNEARALGVQISVLDIAEAELEIRRGRYASAEQAALRAAAALEDGAPMESYAWELAGRCAHLNEQHARAALHFARAQETAHNDAERFSATWGEFIAATESGSGAADFLPLLRALARNDARRSLRVVTGELMTACYEGALGHGIRQAEAARSLVERVQDPYVRSSFLYSLSHCYTFAGRYRDALAASNDALVEADRHGLAFAAPHADLVRAHAETGLRQFASAGSLLERLSKNNAVADPFIQANARFVGIRLALGERRPADALDMALNFIDPTRSIPLQGEHYALVALAHAVQPDLDEARTEEARELAADVSSDSITASLLSAVDLVVGARKGDDTAVRNAWYAIRQAGVFDSAVCAYRGWPPLLHSLVDLPDFALVVRRANDAATLAREGIPFAGPAPPQLLSPREREVHDLLSRGLTNREIARKLFISEVTVKVHVRHILEKFGVRSRTEAAMRTSTGEQRYATAEPDE